jgi:hypothetical protein
MEGHKARAESILSAKTTNDISKAQVYVEYDGDVLYYHSNFVSRGADEDGKRIEYPTKIRGNPEKNKAFRNAEEMLTNIVYTSPPSASEVGTLKQALSNSVKFHVDISVFDQFGRPRVDLTGVEKLAIVDGKRASTVGVQPELLTTSKPPPSLIAKIKGCCLYGRPPHRATALADSLASQPIDSKRVKFASLFLDSATANAIEANSRVKSARLTGDAKSLRSKEDLSKLLDSAKGSTLVMIGHVEASNYVVRDSSNAEVFRISISELRSMAKAKEVRLIDIGCETTKAITESTLGLGVITKYNSVKIVETLNRTLAEAKSYQEFLVGLSSDGLKLVVEPSFVDKPNERTTTVYARAREKARAVWAVVARITLSNYQ